MLINTYWHIPSAAHSFWEFDQVTGTYLDWLRRPIRSNFHFSFKQIADLFCIVCPWEFAWRTAPPINSKCSTTCIKMARMEPQLWKRNTSINSKKYRWRHFFYNNKCMSWTWTCKQHYLSPYSFEIQPQLFLYSYIHSDFLLPSNSELWHERCIAPHQLELLIMSIVNYTCIQHMKEDSSISRSKVKLKVHAKSWCQAQLHLKLAQILNPKTRASLTDD